LMVATIPGGNERPRPVTLTNKAPALEREPALCLPKTNPGPLAGLLDLAQEVGTTTMDNLMRRLGALLRTILVRNGGTQQPGEADPTTRALIAQEQLSHLQDARLDGADVAPWEFLELEEELEAALAAEAALVATRDEEAF